MVPVREYGWRNSQTIRIKRIRKTSPHQAASAPSSASFW
ncbi:hypothetical protein DSM3645_03413 [Blastopirellula marina DSM 3645]|uniref:Uncharacterized protein n=1 Tax=Blastopirellula marina DSM 3645 TaxID=314230 RepID=A3ZVZ6_9BACT|nr:hypothetical protein DSM3645_03413 [Blastopirellula marina DSM 3645]